MDLFALATACLAFYFILRAKKSYFLDSGFFMGLANVGFIIFLLETTIADLTNSPASPMITTSLISVMATSIGVASYLLGKTDNRNRGGIKELARFISRPPLPFLVYLLMVLIWTVSTLYRQPWGNPIQVQLPGGAIYYYYSYPEWYIVTSTILLGAFILLPVLSFYRQSSGVADRKASVSMKIISVSWALFGVITFFQTALGGSFLPLSQSIGLVADSFLFVLISFALKEPTILGRIITAGETISQAVYSRMGADTIVLYNAESDRRRLVETFVKDGLATGQDVVCYVTKAEVPFYRAVLKGSSLASPSYGVHQINIQPVETMQSQPTSKAPLFAGSSRFRRELVDLDELDLEHCRKIIDRVNAFDEISGPWRGGRIWALNVEGANATVLSGLMEKNPRSRVIDLARQQDNFSDLLGLKHEQILGSKILLEYEPTSNFEEVVKKFVREFQANVESIAIFTSMGSPIHRQSRDQRNIRLFSFSTKTSTPARVSDEQILLPERDTSLLLDAIDKLLQAHHGRRVGIVFDVFTDLILFQGFEKAYGVMSSVVEMAESEFATLLVLINYTALEERALNGVRGLFRSQARFDAEGFRTIRLRSLELGRNNAAMEPLTDEERSSRRGITN